MLMASIIQVTIFVILAIIYLYSGFKYWRLKKLGNEANQKDLKKYGMFYYGSIAVFIFGFLIWAIIFKVFN